MRSREESDLDGAAYCYLLGMYLGDGHLVRFPRAWKLQVYLDSRDAVARLDEFVGPKR